MNVLVFGASGATGRHVVQQALALRHTVTAFVRTPSRFDFTHSNLHLFQGDVADPPAILKAINGQDALISTLGVGRPLQHDQAVIDGIRNILRSMDETGVRRLVYLSFRGIEERGGFRGTIMRPLVHRILRHEIADHAEKEALIMASKHDWTIVLAPKLTNGPATGKYRSGEDITPLGIFPTLSRADVAEFTTRQLADHSYIRKSPRLFP